MDDGRAVNHILTEWVQCTSHEHGMDVVELRGITKSFGRVRANDHVDFAVRKGTIHALIGENGAGKTTLMKVLFGLYRPDHGQILLNGTPVDIASPKSAIDLGVGMVHQHFMLLPSLTVAENIVLGVEPARAFFGAPVLFDRRKAVATALEIATRYGLKVDPYARVQDLSVGLRQRVEILKALVRGARVLILDEPTAVLTPQETSELFAIVRSLARDGMTVIFISHKLREVLEVSDNISVMRLGKMIGTVPTHETTATELARMMIGRDTLPAIVRGPAKPGARTLVVEALFADDDRGAHALRGFNISVRAGEIVGIAGVEGNGQSELVEVLCGLRAPRSGRITFNDRDVTSMSTRERREAGLSGIPEDRLKYGVALTAAIRDNLSMSRHYRPPLTWGPFLSPSRMNAYATRLATETDIRTNDVGLPAASLSGGNMQKLVIARELGLDPTLLIAAQPTRGVDIGAIEAIHARLIKARDRGVAVLLISAELSEVMALSDRIAVMYEGAVSGVFAAGTATEDELGLYMLGIKRDSGDAA
jgi:ABC-type uncharacterized transport system ATPase subunit